MAVWRVEEEKRWLVLLANSGKEESEVTIGLEGAGEGLEGRDVLSERDKKVRVGGGRVKGRVGGGGVGAWVIE